MARAARHAEIFDPRNSHVLDSGVRRAEGSTRRFIDRLSRSWTSDRSYRVPILLSLGSFLLVLVFFLQARSGPRLPGMWAYWIGLALILVPGILSSHRIATMFSVGLFAFAQSFSYVLSAPFG